MLKPFSPGNALAAALLGVASLATPAAAQAPANCEGPVSDTWLNVTVTGVRNGNGLMAVTLYDNNSRRFLAKHGSLYTGRVQARAGTTQACIYVPKPGSYAIAVYHDENSSRRLDRNGLGMPAEGFGFSNNPSTFFGIPAFSKVLFNVPRSNLGTTIRLRYP